MNYLIVPSNESAEFARLPKHVRHEAEAWLEALRQVFGTTRRERSKAMAAAARSMCCSWQTVRRKYDLVRKTGSWRAVVNWAKVGKVEDRVSDEIVEEYKKYVESNQRKDAPGWRAMIRDQRAGKLSHIAWPETPAGADWPLGCSYSNLQKLANSTRHELVATRIGRTLAAQFRPLVYTTRRDLWVGSHYMFDDMWHDFFVNTFAERQAGRPLELFSHDLFSGRKVRWGFRVRTRKDDGTMAGLEERMTRMTLAATLFLDGYSPRGTVIVAEHGTAAVSTKLEEAMKRCTGGLVTTARSGMTGAAAHAGQYPGLSKGNFRFKASLESSNNLVHNEFAALPAQTGKDVEHRPEGLAKQLKHNDLLMAAYSVLPPAKKALLQFDLLELNQFMNVAADIYKNIERYTEHTLEGWIEAGLVVNELLLHGQWLDQGILAALTGAEREMAMTLLAGGSLQTRCRKMSRWEAWQTGANELIKAPGFLVCEILGEDLSAERKVRNALWEFEDAEVGPGIHRYTNLAIDPDGRQIACREGETYQVFVNPFAPDSLFVCDAKGGYIGECARINAVSRADAEAVRRACGAAAKREGELLAPIRARHLSAAKAKAARHAHNADVVGGKPVTDEEIADARYTERIERSAQKFGAAVLENNFAGGPDESGSPAITETWEDIPHNDQQSTKEKTETW